MYIYENVFINLHLFFHSFTMRYSTIYLQSPDSACGVNAWSTKQIWVDFIPIKRCQWRTEVGILVLQNSSA